MFYRVLRYMVVILLTMILTTVFHPLANLTGFAQQAGCQTFTETGKTVCGRFLEYWQKNGGLAQQGFPISNPFDEVSDLNGKSYTVQYFERAVFEHHPENQPPHDVLLSQLGTFQFKRKYPNGEPAAGGQGPTTPQPIVGQVFEATGHYGQILRYTVRSVQETPELFEYKARGKFVVLFVTTVNLGDRNDVVRDSAMRLMDDKERRFELKDAYVHRAAHDKYYRDNPYTDVAPKAAAEQLLVFDAAPDAANYILVPAQVPVTP